MAEPSAASLRAMPEIDFSTAECIRRGPRPGPSANPFVSLGLLRIGGCNLSRMEVAQRAGLTTCEVARVEARRDGRLPALRRYARALGGDLAVSITIGKYTFPISCPSERLTMTKKKKIETPLVGRITKVRRALWAAHVPAIGAYTQGRSLADASRMLKRVIEMTLRLDGHKVMVTVATIAPAVDGVVGVSVTCDRTGLLEARAAEFALLSAGVKGPITNPYFVAIQRDGITVEPKLPAKPTNRQRVEHMRERLRLVTDAAWRAGRMRRDAMIYRLGIVGVAAAATTKAFRAKHPSVPWDEAIAMREFLGKPDRLLDFGAVWKAVRETVPALQKAMKLPDLDVAEVIRLNINPAEARELREWAAKNLLPKPKKPKRNARPAPDRQAATTRSRQTGRS